MQGPPLHLGEGWLNSLVINASHLVDFCPCLTTSQTMADEVPSQNLTTILKHCLTHPCMSLPKTGLKYIPECSFSAQDSCSILLGQALKRQHGVPCWSTAVAPLCFFNACQYSASASPCPNVQEAEGINTPIPPFCSLDQK